MRSKLLLASLLLCAAGQANAQLSIQINLGQYPDFEPVPGYPVYYAPRLDSNYFFYDGLYWVYQDDYWYASDWYNGPWDRVEPEFVPVFILRVPVRYYRRPPVYFRSWRPDGPPRWDQHWGRRWAEHHRDWDRWDRRSAPKPAPLPVYQREYTGPRYPNPREQHELHERNYKYRPHENVVRKEEVKQDERKRSHNHDKDKKDDDKKDDSGRHDHDG